jgi:hypothetical protein
MNALCLLLLSTCAPGADPAALQAPAGGYSGYNNQYSQWQPVDQGHHHFLGRLWGHVHHRHPANNGGWNGPNQPDGGNMPMNGNVARNGSMPMNEGMPATQGTPTNGTGPTTEATPAPAPVAANDRPTVATEPVRLVPTPVVTPTASAVPASAGELARPLPRGEPLPVTTGEPPR